MILNQLALHAAARVEINRSLVSFQEIKERAYALEKGEDRLKRLLQSETFTFICELKKASPSKGLIDPKFDYLKIAEEYELAGAEAISCLTEPRWFYGSDEIFEAVRRQTALPMLRKDFIVNEYQIYETKLMGADAILLICAILSDKDLAKFIQISVDLGLSVLVEAYDEREIKRAISLGANIIGVNNRNLNDFTVNKNNALKLRCLVPEHISYVAESGINTPEEVKFLKEEGVDGVLIGEAVMRAADKIKFLAWLRE